MFNTVAWLTGQQEENLLPDGVDDQMLAQDFLVYLRTNGENIRKDLLHEPCYTPTEKRNIPCLENFTDVDVDQVIKLMT